MQCKIEWTWYHVFLYKRHQAEKNIQILDPCDHPNILKMSKSACFREIIWLIIMKMMKMKNRWHRHDINRPRPRHGYKYSKYKKCLRIKMLVCIKQHIWSSINEKVKQHWGWVEKSRIEKRVYLWKSKNTK